MGLQVGAYHRLGVKYVTKYPQGGSESGVMHPERQNVRTVSGRARLGREQKSFIGGNKIISVQTKRRV